MNNFNFQGATKLSQPLLQAGRIFSIDTETHTYDVITDNGYVLRKIPIMFPYTSFEKGQGFIYIPEIGARCLVCNTINGEDFIMGFITPVGKPENPNLNTKEIYKGRLGNKSRDLIPGDMEMGTSSGNKVRVLQGGVVEIIGKEGLCLTKYIASPGENLIISKTDILKHILSSGTFTWETDNTNKTGSIKMELKSDLNKDDPDIIINIGSIAEDEGIDVLIGGEDNPSTKISIAQDGTVNLECKDLKLKSTGDTIIECKSANIKAQAEVNISGSQINLN